jgi:hypothetical protein
LKTRLAGEVAPTSPKCFSNPIREVPAYQRKSHAEKTQFAAKNLVIPF